MTAHNLWLRLAPFHTGPGASSLPLWRTTNHCSHAELPWTTSVWRNSPTNELRLIKLPGGLNISDHLQRFLSYSVLFVNTRIGAFVNIRCHGNVCQFVPTLWLLPAYPLQRKSVFTEALFSNGLFRLSGVISQYFATDLINVQKKFMMKIRFEGK
jgi:hypothetical protein